jgi:hypothetical protein
MFSKLCNFEGTTLCILNTEEFPAVLLNAGNLNIKQLFCTIVCSDDGPLRAETCSSSCVVLV